MWRRMGQTRLFLTIPRWPDSWILLQGNSGNKIFVTSDLRFVYIAFGSTLYKRYSTIHPRTDRESPERERERERERDALSLTSALDGVGG
jgi:hypothetical protein